jgi:tellurite resistance protein TehA-like permease
MMTQTRLVPAWMVLLLAPMVAFAQELPASGESMNQQVIHSPLFWAWMVMLVVAIAAFALVAARLSRHRRPPDRPVAP